MFPLAAPTPPRQASPWQSLAAPYRGKLSSALTRRAEAHRSAAATSFAAVVSMAVELNRGKAARQGVRLHCYVLDQHVPSQDTDGLLGKLDKIIRATASNAHWGSLVTVQAALRNGYVEIGVHYARPAAGCESTIDLIDEQWSWRLGSDAARSC